MKHEELRRLNPLVAVLADWEDANGTMACILPNEWSDLRQAVMDACVDQSPRMLLNALREYAESLERGPVENQPTQSMCRAAVEYMNGADIYSKAPAECLEIEEGIFSEVWKAMQAAAPHPEPAIKQRLTTEPPKMTEAEIEGAATDCLEALAGVDTYDVSLRDHSDAWKAVDTFTQAICDIRDKQWRGEV